MPLAERIRTARERAKLSQVQLAKLSGISQPALSDIESGKSKSPHAKTLLRLADALGQTPEWLADGNGKADVCAPRSLAEENVLADFRRLTAADKKIVLRMLRALVIDR